MTRSDDSDLLRKAVKLAQSSRERGNHPFGALLTAADGTVVLEAENTVVTEHDATGHAETNLVRLASSRYERRELQDMTLYTATEPCAMCAGAIYWAGIGAVVYAFSETALAALTGPDDENPTMTLPCRDVFAAGQTPTVVRGPVDLPEAAEVHDDFWNA